ncbi:MAG: hypothetical protein ACFCUQ_12925 [Kiloniellales bacterium]
MQVQVPFRRVRPTAAQRAYLRRGVNQPGWKLPLFDEQGQKYSTRTIRSCIEQGWAEAWFKNSLKPDWTVCRLTRAGYSAVRKARAQAPSNAFAEVQ